MPIRALVVDDEQLAREELCYLLGELGTVQVVGQAGNGLEAVEAAASLRPEVVFLDVQMPGLDGFEVARRLAASPPVPCIVFVTAFDQYAIEAFDVNAVDYLLKPVDPSRLEESVERARRRRGSGGVLDDRVDRLVRLMADREERHAQIAVKVGERFLLVRAEEIIFASLDGDSITIVSGHSCGTSNYRTLDELQARLDPSIFWRVHRSHLVNINHIKEIVPWFSRNYILRMKDSKGTEIPVSRSQTRRLREYLKL